MIFHGALVCEPWLCSSRSQLRSAKFPHSPPGCRYPMQRPSVSPPLMVRVESTLSTLPSPLFSLPSFSYVLPNAYCKANNIALTESSFFVCFDRPESRHTEIDKLRMVAVGVSGQVAAVCGACSAEARVWDTCPHTSTQCHACRACWFTTQTTSAAGGFLSACHPHSRTIYRHFANICLLSGQQQKSVVFGEAAVARWKQTAVLSAQMTLDCRTLNPHVPDPDSASTTPVHPEDSGNANAGLQSTL